MNDTKELPIAFDVQAVRSAMLSGIIIPRELVNKAFSELNEQLSAQTTKFFTNKGRVTDKREIADNGARLQAIDQTLSLAGLFKQDDRRGSGGPSIPNFAIEVTPNGVIRIAVGSSPAQLQPAFTHPENSLPLENEPTVIPSPGPARSLGQDKDNLISRFNTILDELVDE